MVEEDQIYWIRPWGAHRRGGMEGGDGQHDHHGHDGRSMKGCGTTGGAKRRGWVLEERKKNQSGTSEGVCNR